ncbi:sensor histidine kinase [Frankia sp. Cr1]|uniref:sensor histidine kinase n=1 Tax=Frankia sp. Cr1 TaxID=3073931 RepID=UPI002AD59305|nr:ATP-binding protein [Frankia sp. Cr1]
MTDHREDAAARPRWWRRLSFQLRVTLIATLVAAIGLATAGFLLITGVSNSLLGTIDDAARERAQTLSAVVTRGAVPDPLPSSGADTSIAQVIAPDGHVIASSREFDAGEEALPRPVGGLSAGERIEDRVALAHGHFRILTLPVRTQGSTATIVIASPLSDYDQAVGRVTTAAVVGGPTLLLLLAVAVWTLVRYTLRVVDRIRGQLDAITAADLHRRVDVPPAQDDIRRLALTMNQMLSRLENAATTQRHFVSDAAHELRSPLAALRVQLEVSHHKAEVDRWQHDTLRMIHEVDRLARLVDDLLALSRLDENARPARRDLVDIDEIVLTEARNLRLTSSLAVHTREVCAGLVAGHPDLLTRVVRNLLDNARRHARTRVDLSLSTTGGRVELVVADDGHGIPPEYRDEVFRRFYRLDQARSRDAGGSGLGLAIVHDTVTAHHGLVYIEDNEPGARIVVWLPAAGSQRSTPTRPPPSDHPLGGRPERPGTRNNTSCSRHRKNDLSGRRCWRCAVSRAKRSPTGG